MAVLASSGRVVVDCLKGRGRFMSGDGQQGKMCNTFTHQVKYSSFLSHHNIGFWHTGQSVICANNLYEENDDFITI